MSDNSAPDMSGIDPALLQEFISESQEILDGLDPLFVALESNPEDMSIVDGIFRPVHSVKGNSGFFGLTNIKNFAHIMENILGEIRAGKRRATPPLIDTLLRGVDFLRAMMNRLALGDYSGDFLPEEEAHLELLNQASADVGISEQDTPEAAAARVLSALESTRTTGEMLALENAIHKLICLAVPNFFATQGKGKTLVSVGYMLGGEEVTGYVSAAERFIENLEKNEKEEALCEAFLVSVQAIEDLASTQDNKVVVDLVELLKDDFITIHESGIGFDDLMTSLIRERFDAVLQHLVRIEIGGEEDFLLAGENVTEAVHALQAFVADVIELEKNPGQSDAFVQNIQKLEALAAGNPDLEFSLSQLRDDFVTIHGAEIGFDELMQSLLSDRLITVLSLLDRGPAAKTVITLGGVDVTDMVKSLEAVGANPATLQDEKTRDECVHALQNLAELAEIADEPAMASEAVDLVADIDAALESTSGLDAAINAEITRRLSHLCAPLEKAIVSPETEPDAEPPSEDDSEASPAPDQPSTPAPAPKAASGQELSGKTLRVAEEKVDNFMNFVGELIITGEVFAYIQKKLEQYPEVRQVAQEFKNANLAFGELSTNLQKSLMEVRRVPLKPVLQKLHRIIRDTSAALGKRIDFDISGEDVQIDKSLLEGLESPLVHMVRNSVDHGIEAPEERLAAGKPETGKVWITASATEEKFTLAIQDDGKGLDVDTIKGKAVSRGLLTEDVARNMPDKEAYRLIFNAGLSTARVVTDVSGRGVGMDVVLSNITKMNGNINVDSTLGQGSTFTITLPMTVTLTVIDGLVARIGDQFYIIPLSDVRESVKPTAEQVHIIQGTREVLSVRGELRPIIRLNRILGIYSGNVVENVTDATAMLVQGKRGISAAFLVDEIIGQQSIVVKELGKEFEHIRCLKGGSILGDGRVGLVLNVEGILADMGLTPPED